MKKICYFLCLLAEILGRCLWLRNPAKSMVRHLEGKLQNNYRVGPVYVERHTIWREVTTENSVYTIGKSSSVTPLTVGQAQRDFSQKHLEVMEGRL